MSATIRLLRNIFLCSRDNVDTLNTEAAGEISKDYFGNF